jgi:glyoxylase-like metal-dependent hydrolase (beta-lactamase superfamily II)
MEGATMREVAAGLWQLRGWPLDLFNVYLAGDVLLDAGTRWARPRILRQLHGRAVRLLALTHCHPDHQGSARVVCERLGVPLACHEDDAPAVAGREAMLPRNWALRLSLALWAGPPCPVGRVLRDGDVVAGFRVVHAPGHTPGHVLFFRESDRVCVAGDVLANVHFVTGRVGLREPPAVFSADPARNRLSVRVLAGLRPKVVCFGHGPPLLDGESLQRFAAGLEATPGTAGRT